MCGPVCVGAMCVCAMCVWNVCVMCVCGMCICVCHVCVMCGRLVLSILILAFAFVLTLTFAAEHSLYPKCLRHAKSSLAPSNFSISLWQSGHLKYVFWD